MPTKKNLEASKTSGNSPTSRTDLISKVAVVGSPNAPDGLLTPEQAQKILQVSRRTIQRLTDGRRITYVKIGGSVRFHPSAIDAYIKANTVQSKGAAPTAAAPVLRPTVTPVRRQIAR